LQFQLTFSLFLQGSLTSHFLIFKTLLSKGGCKGNTLFFLSKLFYRFLRKKIFSATSTVQLSLFGIAKVTTFFPFPNFFRKKLLGFFVLVFLQPPHLSFWTRMLMQRYDYILCLQIN